MQQQELVQVTEEVACKLITADPGDLTGLASLHTKLQQLRDQPDAVNGAVRDEWVRLTRKAENDVEQLILGGISDVERCLKELSAMAGTLQQLAAGDASAATPPWPPLLRRRPPRPSAP
ncbi:MAG: hypothetical protein QM702_03545 [Rubrivivax sp.]